MKLHLPRWAGMQGDRQLCRMHPYYAYRAYSDAN